MKGSGQVIKKVEEQKLWNRNYINLILANVFGSLGFHLVNPILSKFAMQMGATLTTAGMIVGLFAITALIVGPFGGFLTDRTNKKYVMIFGTIINAFATFGYSLAPNISTLFLLRIIHGAAFSITIATVLAWATDFIPGSRFGEGIGYLGIAQIVATAFGPAIGIEISSKFSIYIAFQVSAAILTFSALIMLFVPSFQNGFFKEQSVDKRKIRFTDIVALELLPLSIIGGLFSMGNGLASSFLVLVGQERSIEGIGLYFSVNALFLLMTRPVSGRIYDKKGLSVILYPSLVFGIIEALLIGRANVLWMIILAAILKAFGQGMAQPALQAESFLKLGRDRRGVASSTFYIGANMGQGFGPLIGGKIATVYGFTGMFNFSAGVLAVGILGYYVYTRRCSRVEETMCNTLE